MRILSFNARSRLMHGSSYVWGSLVPASILLFVGFYLSAQLTGAVKLTAALQVDQRSRNKIIKRRGLQIGLFFKVTHYRRVEFLTSDKGSFGVTNISV